MISHLRSYVSLASRIVIPINYMVNKCWMKRIFGQFHISYQVRLKKNNNCLFNPSNYPMRWLCWAVLSHSVMSDSLQSYGPHPARHLCPWGFSRQEYWSGLPCPPPGDLPNPGIKPRASCFAGGSPALQVDSLWSESLRKPNETVIAPTSQLKKVTFRKIIA